MSWVRSVTHVSGPDNGKDGAPGRTRTADPLITNQVLYQLSYKGIRRSVSTKCARVKSKLASTIYDPHMNASSIAFAGEPSRANR